MLMKVTGNMLQLKFPLPLNFMNCDVYLLGYAENYQDWSRRIMVWQLWRRGIFDLDVASSLRCGANR